MPLVLKDKCFSLRPPTVFGTQLYGDTSPSSKYYADLNASGASWVRVEIYWSSIEPVNTTPANYDWSELDLILAAADSSCINMVATLNGNPTWAATSTEGAIDKVGLNELAEFMGALVERYDGDGISDASGSPKVLYFEMYNEPDAGPSPTADRWGDKGVQYAQMLAAVYPAVKAARSEAKVVFGGIAYDWWEKQSGPFVERFLEDVLAAGGGQSFDIMNFHAYPLFRNNWTQNGVGLKEKTAAIRAKLQQYGVSKPIIITETGWHSNAPANAPSSDEVEIRCIVVLLTQSLAAQVDMAVWWPLADVGGFYTYDSGLVTNATPPVRKPAFFAYRFMSDELRLATYERSLSTAETGNARVEAYKFKDPAHNQSIYVAWQNPKQEQWLDPNLVTPAKTMTLAAAQATVRDVFGNSTLVKDGDDGKNDGRITVQVKPMPIYVEISN